MGSGGGGNLGLQAVTRGAKSGLRQLELSRVPVSAERVWGTPGRVIPLASSEATFPTVDLHPARGFCSSS